MMTIHVVQEGDTIQSIADSYGVSVTRLVQENELTSPDDLVLGQTIVVTFPEKTYIVKEGDTLEGIANTNGISMNQLLRNNAFLVEREYIYPGETLVISYQYDEKISTFGYALPFINQTILRKTLPFLTYLFIYNYGLASNGNLLPFYDDTDIVETTKSYSALPILLVTTLTAQGSPNVQATYDILLNESIQDILIDNILNVLKSKGYYGLCLTYLYLSESNQNLYINFTTKVSTRLKNEGYPLFITADPGIRITSEGVDFNRVDYSSIASEVLGISFISYVWGTNITPPSPISSITNIKLLLEYVSQTTPVDKIIAGLQIVGYDWEIPFIAGFTRANVLSIEGAINLAREVGAVIQFDEVSQTPYYEYVIEESFYTKHHIVWFIDARTINSLTNLVLENQYRGPSVWNIMNFYPQLWLVLNSQYELEELI
jgi:spore germination protein